MEGVAKRKFLFSGNEPSEKDWSKFIPFPFVKPVETEIHQECHEVQRGVSRGEAELKFVSSSELSERDEPQSHPTPVLKAVTVTAPPPQAQPGFEQRKSIYEAIQTPRLRCASAALAHYNEQHGTDYKLVYALECNRFMPPREMIHWYHCNFLAAVPEPPYDGGGSLYIKLTDDDSSSAKLFFAELNYPTSTHPVITACYILDGADQIQRSCLSCCGDLAHPTSGFHKGVGKRSLNFALPGRLSVLKGLNLKVI